MNDEAGRRRWQFKEGMPNIDDYLDRTWLL
jgi:hypothetical protein